MRAWHLPARERCERAGAMQGGRAHDDHLDRGRPAADLSGRNNGGLREFLHDFPAVSSTRVQSVNPAQPAQTGINGDVAGVAAGQERPRGGRVAGVGEDTEGRLQLLGGGG